MENLDRNDEVKINVLTLKELGESFNKIKFHLDAAIKEYNFVEKKRTEIENKAGVKMQYLV